MRVKNGRQFLVVTFLSITAVFIAGWSLSGKNILQWSTPQPIKNRFSFIRYDLNEMEIYAPESAFLPLFNKLERLISDGEGDISILHIGGSHVQGGFLTDRLRENFQSFIPGLTPERGFVFPYKMAGTNCPSSIKATWTGKWTGCRNSVSTHACNWGMSGISALCSDTIAEFSIEALRTDSSYYRSNMVRVYYESIGEYSIEADSALSVKEILNFEEEGYIEFHFNSSYESFKFRIRQEDQRYAGTFYLQGFYFGNDSPGIVYNAIGVNGAGTYSYLKCGLFGPQMKTIAPDLVFFGIGVNDANVPESDFNPSLYEARYDSLVSLIKVSNPNAALVFITNNDTYYQRRFPNPNALKVQETMQRLAEKHNAAVYDLFAIMGGLGSIDDWRDASLAAKDRIHLSRNGYELQADLMFEAFRNAFGDYLSSKHSP